MYVGGGGRGNKDGKMNRKASQVKNKGRQPFLVDILAFELTCWHEISYQMKFKFVPTFNFRDNNGRKCNFFSFEPKCWLSFFERLGKLESFSLLVDRSVVDKILSVYKTCLFTNNVVYQQNSYCKQRYCRKWIVLSKFLLTNKLQNFVCLQRLFCLHNFVCLQKLVCLQFIAHPVDFLHIGEDHLGIYPVILKGKKLITIKKVFKTYYW